MRWDDELARLFEDLEQQAEGLHLADRDAEVADRSAAEYAQVSFVSRLRASLGDWLVVEASGSATLRGRLSRLGQGWLLLDGGDPAQEWVVRTSAITSVRGGSAASASDAAGPATERLGLRSVLRGLAESREAVLFLHCDGSRTRGQVARVGNDFVEVLPGAEGDGGGLPDGLPAHLVPFEQLSVVRRL